jgi:hypothetical protein
MRRVLLILSLSIVACSSAQKKGTAGGTGTAPAPFDASPVIMPTIDAAPPPPPKTIGSGCTPSKTSMQGDCPDGMLCFPGPGGYCLTMCGPAGPCAAGSTCVQSPRVSDICLASCVADGDCRQGYVCDPAWKTCVMPHFLAPKPPVCQATALARKSFGKVTQMSTAHGPAIYDFEPAIGIDKKGALTAVYIANGALGAKNPLGVSTLTPDGKIVDGDRAIDGDRENHFDPWVATDRDGKLYAVWLAFDGGRAPEKNMAINLSTSVDGKTWSTPVVSNDVKIDCPAGDAGAGCMDKPMIAVGPDKADPKSKKDAIYVFYFSEPGGGMKMTKSIDGGATFGDSVKVGDGAYGDAEVSSDGVIHVVYVDGEPGGDSGGLGSKDSHVQYTESADGGKTFSKPVVVSRDDGVPFYFSNPQVVADVDKKLLYVVYPAGTPDLKWDIFLATSKDGGKKWTSIKVNDDEPCASHMTPTAAIDVKTGKVHVAWLENRTGSGGVAYAVCERGGKKCGANEAVNDQAFAGYGVGRFSSQWLGEYFGILVDAKRRMLHIVWTQPVDENGVPISRIFHSAAKL